MLRLLDSYAKTIKQWNHNSIERDVTFTVHNSDIIYYFEDENNITIFYGFLDQENPYKNPAQYVSELLSKHGIKTLNGCYGSFIVIHFEKDKQHYLIANDAMGDFAVHYQDSNILQVSDLPQALLTKNNSALNHLRLLHFFATSKPQTKACFFEKIKQLNPGHCLTVKKNTLHVDQYYFPKLVLNKSRKNTDELAEEFKSLMQQVINDQTKGQKKVGVMMSGGMDSTFVAAHCQKANKKVNTYSYVFPKIPEANESHWIDAMRHRGFNMHTFAGESYWPLKSPWPISLNAPINNPYRHLKTVIYQQAQAQGIKTLLTGVFADHMYTGYIYWLVDQIRYKPLTAIKSLFKTTKNKGFITALRQISPAKFSQSIKVKSPWMTIQAQSELKQASDQNKYKHPHPQQFDLVFGISTAQSSFLENEQAFKNNIHLRHPFRDRRIIEFLMSLPAWVLGDIENPKRFVRYSAKDLLPNSIINRNKISTLLPFFHQGVFEKEFNRVKEVLTDSSCEWHEYVKKDFILNTINNSKNQLNETNQVILWQCLNYELWRCRIAEISP